MSRPRKEVGESGELNLTVGTAGIDGSNNCNLRVGEPGSVGAWEAWEFAGDGVGVDSVEEIEE